MCGNNRNGLTPIEKRLADRLSDGRGHGGEVLLPVIGDRKVTTRNTLQVHMCNLRKKFPAGQMIVHTTINRKKHYQHVRALASPYDGRS